MVALDEDDAMEAEYPWDDGYRTYEYLLGAPEGVIPADWRWGCDGTLNSPCVVGVSGVVRLLKFMFWALSWATAWLLETADVRCGGPQLPWPCETCAFF